MRSRSFMSFALALLLAGGVWGARAQAPAANPSVDQGVEKNPPVEEKPDPCPRAGRRESSEAGEAALGELAFFGHETGVI